MRDGLSRHQSTLTLAKAFEVDRRIAAEWVHISIDRFRDLGLLETAGSTATAQAPRTREASPKSATSTARRGPCAEFRLFEQILHLAAPPGPLAVVESLLAAMRTDPAAQEEHGRPDIEIDIVANGNRWDIVVGGQLEATCEARSIAAEVERLLVQRALPGDPSSLDADAAALQRGGRAWLLTGLSGAGKTTLSLALARAGWRFGSDEIVLSGGTRIYERCHCPPASRRIPFR